MVIDFFSRDFDDVFVILAVINGFARSVTGLSSIADALRSTLSRP